MVVLAGLKPGDKVASDPVAAVQELIKKGDDPIAFDHDCREGICGTCGIVINGAPHGPVSPASPVGNVPLLKAAAELCTDFGRLTDSRDLTRLLSRVATVMDASGVVVWLGDHPGADLRPVFAHGYSDQALARMTATAIPRAADNAVAAAYRSETLQVVLSRPGASNGAVVAPLLTPEGCIGAFTAELLAGRETSEAVQAIASLFAAQLTGVLAASVQRAESPATQRVVSR